MVMSVSKKNKASTKYGFVKEKIFHHFLKNIYLIIDKIFLMYMDPTELFIYLMQEIS